MYRISRRSLILPIQCYKMRYTNFSKFRSFCVYHSGSFSVSESENSSVSISNLLEEYLNSASPSPSPSLSPFHGLNIHSRIVKTGCHSNLDINIKLLILHLKFGSVNYARQLFDEMSQPALSAYIYLLNAYVKHGQITEAFDLVKQICTSGLKPDSFLHSLILKAWAALPRSLFLARDFGKQVHAQIIYGGDSNSDIRVFETLIDSYVKSGKIDYARRLFDRVLINPNVVCSTSLISGYMNAGRFDEAETVFKSIDEKDVGVFNAMIEGYSKSTDTAKKAVEMYFDMLRLGFLPTDSTITSLLGACSLLASPKVGRQVHSHLMTILDCMDVEIGSAVIDMYCKCGNVGDARRIFDNMPEKNEYSWTSMIDGYGRLGTPSEVMEMFTKMQEEAHIKPNYVTFLCALSACAHAGLVSKGWDIFESMERKYSLKPQMEHYACMVDLLGRSGRLKQAWAFVMRMPENPNSDVWAALLSSARLQGDMEMAGVAVDELFKLGALSKPLAETRKGDCVDELREIGIDDTLEKEPTQSVISKDTGCGDDSVERIETIQIDDTLEKKEPTQGVISEDTGFSLTSVDDSLKKNEIIQIDDTLEKKEPTQSVILKDTSVSWTGVDDSLEKKETIQIDDTLEKKEPTESVKSEDTELSWTRVFDTLKKRGAIQIDDTLEKKEPTQSVIPESIGFSCTGVDDCLEEKETMQMEDFAIELQDSDSDSN
ncbi:pentatricopeptide repeat-containing protein At1g28690, mitochondrial-like [Silene latifolia]|uniref:pentatricopeptide repeat-containing protein At1g28690, mitochondrial-like n=1 Tax=Silene latifolia TaxID=37657 RepID=UPI003D78AD0C